VGNPEKRVVVGIWVQGRSFMRTKPLKNGLYWEEVELWDVIKKKLGPKKRGLGKGNLIGGEK